MVPTISSPRSCGGWRIIIAHAQLSSSRKNCKNPVVTGPALSFSQIILRIVRKNCLQTWHKLRRSWKGWVPTVLSYFHCLGLAHQAPVKISPLLASFIVASLPHRATSLPDKELRSKVLQESRMSHSRFWLKHFCLTLHITMQFGLYLLCSIICMKRVLRVVSTGSMLISGVKLFYLTIFLWYDRLYITWTG